MKKRMCHIVGAGDFYGIDLPLSSEDYIIAADGGLSYLEQEQITADLIIGDFDSLGGVPNHPNVIALNSEKDDTDTLAAVKEGIKVGYDTFSFHACVGGRIEHTLANIQTLAYLAQNGMQGFLFDKDDILTVVTNGDFSFASHENGFISVFSLSDQSTGVCLKGLKYELDKANLTNTFPIGVSNEFIGKPSTIMVGDGMLLIGFPRRYKEDLL